MDFLGGSIWGIIGCGVGWMLTQWQASATISKLKAEKAKLEQEEIKCAGENLTKLQENRRAYDNAGENCKQIALKLFDELKTKTEKIVNTRENLCTALCNDAIPNYVNFIEWEQLLAKKDLDELKKLIDDVIFELRRFNEWITIINNKEFTQNMNLSPLKVNKRTLDPFLKLLKDLPCKDKNTVETILRNAVGDIIKNGL